MVGDWHFDGSFGQSRGLNVCLFYWLCWASFCCTWAFSRCSKQKRLSSYLCAGFSLLGLLLLQSTGFGAQVQYLCCTGLLLWDTWHPPTPGIKPGSHALAGRLFTTAPPGKFYSVSFNWVLSMLIHCQTNCSHRPITGRSENQERVPQTYLDLLKRWMDPRDPFWNTKARLSKAQHGACFSQSCIPLRFHFCWATAATNKLDPWRSGMSRHFSP